MAWQATNASAAYLTATTIQGLIVLNYPNYTFERWHGTLLLYAILLIAVIFNTGLASHLPKLERLILVLHILGFFAVLIPLVKLAPHNSAHDVFALFLNGGSFQTQALSFFVGTTATVFAFIGKLPKSLSFVYHVFANRS